MVGWGAVATVAPEVKARRLRSMLPRVILIVAIVLAAGVALTALVGSYSWRSSTAALNAGLEAERVPSAVAVYHVDELAGLPEPVVDYFR